MNGKKRLALYDFAAKQEYIYRTPKIKEISGASQLLSGMYRKFVEIVKPALTLEYDMNAAFSLATFDSEDIDGKVLYDGGGNLMVLWKSEEAFVNANRMLSGYVLENAPGVQMIACSVDCTGNFSEDRRNLYRENTRMKNTSPAFDIPAVTPFTQVDMQTFLPVTYKRKKGAAGSVYPASEVSLSSDRLAKALSYKKAQDIDEEGMLAVVYIDGNAMGEKLKKCDAEQYDEGVRKLRAFSSRVNQIFVANPMKKLEDDGYVFRQIIGGGDEITIICRAEDALAIMQSYFTELQAESQEEVWTSCAGIAVFHAKEPFNVAYDIAEAACEAAKKKAHMAGNTSRANCFSFYYCHAGITNTYDVLVGNEQNHCTGKPYCFDDIALKFEACKEILNNAGRSNVKALGNAAQEGPASYRREVERVNAYLPKNSRMLEDGKDMDKLKEEMKLVYDMSEFYDLWFAGRE